MKSIGVVQLPGKTENQDKRTITLFCRRTLKIKRGECEIIYIN